MNAEDVLREFYLALERATGEGNIHKARAAARAIGLKFTNQDSSVWLKPFIDAAAKRRTASAPVAALILGTGNEHESAPVRHLNGTTNGLTRGKVVPSTSLRIPFSAENGKVNTNGATGPPEWLARLRVDVKALGPTKLCDLAGEARILFARWDAAQHGHFCRDEGKNRREGLRLAPVFARLGAAKREAFEGMTCAEYARAAKRWLEMRGGKPFHNPFEVEAAIEYEEVT